MIEIGAGLSRLSRCGDCSRCNCFNPRWPKLIPLGKVLFAFCLGYGRPGRIEFDRLPISYGHDCFQRLQKFRGGGD